MKKNWVLWNGLDRINVRSNGIHNGRWNIANQSVRRIKSGNIFNGNMGFVERIGPH